MSIILNALRKSEQQRQLHQSQDIDNSTQGLNELKQKSAPAWLIALVVVNLFFLSYVVWTFSTTKSSAEKDTKQIEVKESDKAKINTNAIPQNIAIKTGEVKVQQHVVLEKPITSELVQKVQLPVQLSQLNNVSQNKLKPETTDSVNKIKIADMIKIENEKSSVAKPVKVRQQLSIEDQIKKTRDRQKTLVNNQEVTNIEKIKSRQTDNELIRSDFDGQLQTKSASKAIKIKTELANKTNEENKMPWLSELSHQFRRTVPEIKINVYVYSENKKDRFIMVNMVKHVHGHDLGEGMILKEIRMNSFVVEYKNKVFRVKRK